MHIKWANYLWLGSLLNRVVRGFGFPSTMENQLPLIYKGNWDLKLEESILEQYLGVYIDMSMLIY